MLPSLKVEGWLHYTQSFSIITGNHLLELGARDFTDLVYSELPPPPQKMLRRDQAWKPGRIWNDEQTNKLSGINSEYSRKPCSTILRIGFPYDFTPSVDGKTYVFAVTEIGHMPSYMLRQSQSLATLHDSVDIITPSQWSKNGLVNSGVEPSKIHIVPHGVDPVIFYPLDISSRESLRQKLGWSNRFIVLNIGAQYEWKGIMLLLLAFSEVAQKDPDALLVLKGVDSVYNSRNAVTRWLGSLSPARRNILAERVKYTGTDLLSSDLAELYQAADVLVAPYHAEGFNLPVLEAVACGLPVICTRNGPTDDFINDSVGWRIPSRYAPAPGSQGMWLYPDGEALIELMLAIRKDDTFRREVRISGPEHVRKSHTWSGVTDRLLDVMFPKTRPA